MNKEELIKEAYYLGYLDGLQKRAFKNTFNRILTALDNAANYGVIWEKLRGAQHVLQTEGPRVWQTFRERGMRETLERDVPSLLENLKNVLTGGGPMIQREVKSVKSSEIPLHHVLLGVGAGLGLGAGTMYLLRSKPVKISKED